MPGEPQPIIDRPTEAAIFLVLTVNAGAESELLDVLSDVTGIKRSVGFRIPDGDLRCIVGIGSELWDRLYPGGPKPKDLHRLKPLAGDKHSAPSTPGDLLFHIRAHRLDLCFELAQRLCERLRPFTTVVDEVHGFKSFDERDLLGFVDGTENPEGIDAVQAVLIPETDDPDFGNGSYVLVQKYLHNLNTWDALTTEEQERVIGRTKLSDLELPDDVKPSNSHVALNTIVDEDGTERDIVRFNMPFGRVGSAEFGTYFIGYAADPGITELMLQNMFIGKPAGNYDRVLDFSTAVTGGLFFIPTIDFLDDPPEPVAGAATADGSLGIGALKGASS